MKGLKIKYELRIFVNASNSYFLLAVLARNAIPDIPQDPSNTQQQFAVWGFSPQYIFSLKYNGGKKKK